MNQHIKPPHHTRLTGLLSLGLLGLPLAAGQPSAVPEETSNRLADVLVSLDEAPATMEDVLVNLGATATEKVTWLGVSVEPPGEVVRHQLKLTRGAGLTVTQVAKSSPAEDQLHRHDILLKLDDQWLFNAPQLASLVQSHAAGESVNLTLLREGEETTVAIALAEHERPAGAAGVVAFPGQTGVTWQPALDQLIETLRPPSPPAVPPVPALPGTTPHGFLGVEVQPPDASVLAQLGRDADIGGVLLGFVMKDSPAEEAGLRQYDLVIAVNEEPVKSPEAFVKTVRDRQPGDQVTLQVLRAGQKQEVAVTLGKPPASAPRVADPPLHFQIQPAPGAIEWRRLPGASAVPPAGDDLSLTMPDQVNKEVIVLRGSTGHTSGSAGMGGVAFGAEGGWSSAGFGSGVSDADGTVQNLKTRITTRSSGSGPGPQQRLRTVLMRDENGEMTVKQENDVRHILLKSPTGDTVFEGDLGAALKNQDLAPELRARLEHAEELIEQQNQYEKQTGTPPAPALQIRELRIIKPPAAPGFIRWEREEGTSANVSSKRV